MRGPRRVGEPAPIQEVLPAVLRGLQGTATGPVERARKAWGEVVGPLVASRTRVASVENGRVRVEVASAALKHDLATFQRLRGAFDPDGLANPGKVLPTPRLCGEVPGPYRAHPLERLGVAERL